MADGGWPQSLSSILTHLIFSTKNRQPFLTGAVALENMIRYTADAVGLCTEVAANGCQIRVNPLADFAVQPWFTILGAEDEMNNDLAERLRHRLDNAPNPCPNESRFQRWSVLFDLSLGVAPGSKC